MVTKVEKRNKYDIWLKPKCYYNGSLAGKVLSSLVCIINIYQNMNMKNPQRLSPNGGVKLQAYGRRKISPHIFIVGEQIVYSHMKV